MFSMQFLSIVITLQVLHDIFNVGQNKITQEINTDTHTRTRYAYTDVYISAALILKTAPKQLIYQFT